MSLDLSSRPARREGLTHVSVPMDAMFPRHYEAPSDAEPPHRLEAQAMLADIKTAIALADQAIVACNDGLAGALSLAAFAWTTKQQAPFDLEAFGIDHPHRRWVAAVAHLHRLKDEGLWPLDRLFKRVRLLIETHRAFCVRHGTFAPGADDLREAILRIAAVTP